MKAEMKEGRKKEMKTVEHLKYDVVCVGGGSAGVFAAVSAARMGAKVLLIERAGFLGGTSTLGEILRGLPKKLTEVQKHFLEILRELNGVRERLNGGGYVVNGEILKLAFQRLCRENGVETILFSASCELRVRNYTVTGLSVVGKHAMLEIEVPIIIDATGTGDVARCEGLLKKNSFQKAWGTMILTGICFEKLLDNQIDGKCEEGFRQAIPGTEYYGPLFSNGPDCKVSVCLEPHRYLVQFPVEGINNPMDAVNRSEAIASAHIQALHLLRRLSAQPGFEEVRISQMPSQLKLYGDYEVKGLEQVEYSTSERAVAEIYRTDGSVSYIGLEHLIPNELEGFLVCGNLTLQGMTDRDRYSRAISLITGEMAGLCAGLTVKRGFNLRNIDAEEVKNRIERKVLL